jgi:hypothetical protein
MTLCLVTGMTTFCVASGGKHFDLFPDVLYGYYETPTGLLTNSLYCSMWWPSKQVCYFHLTHRRERKDI